MKNDRVLLALAVTALMPTLVIGVASAISVSYEGTLEVFLGMILVYVVALHVTVILGLPVFLVFRRFNLLGWWSALGAGAFAGYLTALVFGVDTFIAPILHGHLPFVVIGAVSGLVFFAVYQGKWPTPPNFRWSGP